MAVKIVFRSQLKRAVGSGEATTDWRPGLSIGALFVTVAERHPELRPILLTADDIPRPSVIVLLNDRPVNRVDEQPVADGDVVTLLSPMAGG